MLPNKRIQSSPVGKWQKIKKYLKSRNGEAVYINYGTCNRRLLYSDKSLRTARKKSVRRTVQ